MKGLLYLTAENAEQPDTTGEEKTNDGSKPANGTADSNSSQSASSKKVQELKAGELGDELIPHRDA